VLKSLSLRNLAHLTFKRRRTFLGALIVPPLLCAAVVLPQKSQYESYASLMVKIIDQEVVAPDLLSQQQSSSALSSSTLAKQIISSEMLIITSGDVVKKAIERVGVEKVYPDIQEAAKKARVPVMEMAAERFSKDMTVKPSGETNVLALSVFNSDAKVAQTLLRSLISATMEKQASVLRDPRTDFLERKLETLRQEADVAKRALAEFKRRTRITSFDEERTLLLRQRDDVQLRLSQTRAELAASTGRGEALQGSLAATPDEVALSDENDRAQRALDQAQGRLTAARARYENAKRRFTANNPELIDIGNEVAAAEKEVETVSKQSMSRVRKGLNPLAQQLSGGLSTARSEATAAKVAVKERERQLESINARLAYLDSSEIELRELENKQNLADSSYKSYQQRAESARIVHDMNEAGISGLSIVEQPTLPYKAARPRKGFLIGLALAAGLVAGLGLCLLRETLDDTISFPEELEDVLGLPVLASVKLKNGG